MSGDNLAVALFLWSLAVFFFFEGRKDEGWRHWTLWGVALACLVAGFLWPHVASWWPRGFDFVRVIAVSPVSWFVLFMSAAMLVAITGRLKRAQEPYAHEQSELRAALEALRKPVTAPSTPIQVPAAPNREWLSTRSALSKFCDPQTYQTMISALNACVSHTAYQADLQAQYDAGSRALSEGRTVPNHRTIERDLIEAGKKVEPLNRVYKQAMEICLYDLKTRLASGALIARAFKCPYSGEEEPTSIAVAQWYALNFDMDDSDWQTVKADHTKYIGLQIAKA